MGQNLFMTFTQKKILWIWYQLEGLFFETKKLVIHLWCKRIYKPGSRSTVSPGAGTGKGLADHFNIRALVCADFFAATTLYLLILGCKGIFFGNSCLVATQNLNRANLVIFPQLVFTGSATDNEHIISWQGLRFLITFNR